MTCLHLRPEDLLIPDWEGLEGIIVAVSQECGAMLDKRFDSQSGASQEL